MFSVRDKRINHRLPVFNALGATYCTQRGFSITFANGWTVSVQFGNGNYCAARDPEHTKDECPDAEIAAWKGDIWYKFSKDQDCAGWQSPEQVAAFISKIAGLK